MPIPLLSFIHCNSVIGSCHRTCSICISGHSYETALSCQISVLRDVAVNHRLLKVAGVSVKYSLSLVCYSTLQLWKLIAALSVLPWVFSENETSWGMCVFSVCVRVNLISLFIHSEAMHSTICLSCWSFPLHISLNRADSRLVNPSFPSFFALIHAHICTYPLILSTSRCSHPSLYHSCPFSFLLMLLLPLSSGCLSIQYRDLMELYPLWWYI